MSIFEDIEEIGAEPDGSIIYRDVISGDVWNGGAE